MADANEPVLSVAAAACMRERLPGLLVAVRARRRRRRAARAALLVALVGVASVPWWRDGASPSPVGPVAPVRGWTSFGNDPTVLARHTIVVPVRPEWFVAADDELRALLAAADREAGVVRVGARLLVSSRAVDPFPGAQP